MAFESSGKHVVVDGEYLTLSEQAHAAIANYRPTELSFRINSLGAFLDIASLARKRVDNRARAIGQASLQAFKTDIMIQIAEHQSLIDTTVEQIIPIASSQLVAETEIFLELIV